MVESLKRHWPEYLMEAAGLGIFMTSAAIFATILEYPGSFIHQAIPSPFLRRALMGLAMGLTAIGIIYSPWGQRSGAHINPAITMTFFRLGKVAPWDAVFYVTAQFIGGLVGILLGILFIGQYLMHPAVNYVATVPGPQGISIAFLAEMWIAFILMLVILLSTNAPKLARFTGLFAAVLIALYIMVESPLSGFGMNPARTFASALAAWLWKGFWIYMIAPPLGMLLAAETYLWGTGKGGVICAKLHHHNNKRCIFRCGYKPELTS